VKSAAYGVGIEGGIHQYPYGWFERSLVVIVDRKEKSESDLPVISVTQKVIDQIQRGKTLEEA